MSLSLSLSLNGAATDCFRSPRRRHAHVSLRKSATLNFLIDSPDQQLAPKKPATL